MAKSCYFTGRKTTFGNTIARSGAAISKGGFGLKTTGINRRKFKANLHTMTILVDGKAIRTSVSTKAMKSGLVIKPLKRKYGYTRQQKQAQQG